MDAFSPPSSKNQKLCWVDSNQAAREGAGRVEARDAKKRRSVRSSAGIIFFFKKLQGNCAQHRQGCWRGWNYRNGKFAEKVCISLFMWLERVSGRETPAGKILRHPKIFTGMSSWRDDVRVKQHFRFVKYLNILHFFFPVLAGIPCIKAVWGIFSVVPVGFFSSLTFREHLSINLLYLNSCSAPTGEKHQTGTRLPLSNCNNPDMGVTHGSF